ncbi:MAG: hypothetical protein H0X39_19690, partial [Actinobacteria bacterium]|nr:hypothetical protein [Actinomycetota bacterium]
MAILAVLVLVISPQTLPARARSGQRLRNQPRGIDQVSAVAKDPHPKPFTAHYLEAPEGLLDESPYPTLSVHDGQLVSYARDNDVTNLYPDHVPILARTPDGVRWDVRKMPKTLREYDWSRFGLVALDWPIKPSKSSQFELDDGNRGF